MCNDRLMRQIDDTSRCWRNGRLRSLVQLCNQMNKFTPWESANSGTLMRGIIPLVQANITKTEWCLTVLARASVLSIFWWWAVEQGALQCKQISARHRLADSIWCTFHYRVVEWSLEFKVMQTWGHEIGKEDDSSLRWVVSYQSSNLTS